MKSSSLPWPTDNPRAREEWDFLNKSQTEIKNIVRPVLEKHLSSVLGSSRIEETIQNPAACAAKVQTAAAGDLGKMGVGIISFTIRNAHAA